MLPLAALLSGCGLDLADGVSAGVGSGDANDSSVAVSGAAVKGVIRQGIVTANRLEADRKTGHYGPGRVAAKAVRTADDGSYNLQMRGKAEGWALVELRADDSTRMVCDVVPSCDQADAEPVAFGETLGLDREFILRGAGDLSAETIYLTPLTHLAVTLAERGEDGLSPATLSNAYQAVEGWFDLSAGALRLAPPDLTRLDDTDNVSADALQVAIVNAAFLALVNEKPQWQSIADVLADVTAQIETNGLIDITGDGVNLALADVVSTAALQASQLQLAVDSSVISHKLVLVEYRNVHRLKTIADVYEDTDTSIADNDRDTTDGPDSPETVTDPVSGPVVSDTDDATVESPTSGTDTLVGGTDSGSTDTDSDQTDTTTGADVPANAALLSWTAPFTRVNGDSLSMGEIAGYEVVYGVNPDALDQSMAIGDASIDELLIDELGEGTWHFAIRTLDTDGKPSQLSEVLTKQI